MPKFGILIHIMKQQQFLWLLVSFFWSSQINASIILLKQTIGLFLEVLLEFRMQKGADCVDLIKLPLVTYEGNPILSLEDSCVFSLGTFSSKTKVFTFETGNYYIIPMSDLPEPSCQKSKFVWYNLRQTLLENRVIRIISSRLQCMPYIMSDWAQTLKSFGYGCFGIINTPRQSIIIKNDHCGKVAILVYSKEPGERLFDLLLTVDPTTTIDLPVSRNNLINRIKTLNNNCFLLYRGDKVLDGAN